MKRVADLPGIVPVFPLPGALLLPRARLPLHIFEPRYLAMIDDALKTDHRLIGMIQPRDVPGTTEKRLHAIGCAGRVTALSETEDGRYLITLTGVSRYRVIEEEEGFLPYRRCEVEWTPFARDRGNPEEDPGFDRACFMDLLGRFFDESKLSTNWGALEDAEDEFLINSISMLCPFEPEDKQALLEAPTLTTRRETLNTLLEFSMHGGHGEDMMQ